MKAKPQQQQLFGRAQLRLSLLILLLCAIVPAAALAQSPAGSAPPANDETTGLILNASFNGSLSSGGDVYDWTTAAGYVFDKHFSADFGVPFLFVHGTTSTGATTTNSGLGNIFGQLQFVERNPLLNSGAVATVALPTGDSSKGFSTGRVTADLTGQMAKPVGRFTPFLSAGVANSIFDSPYWSRPYTTLGNIVHFEGGTSFALAHFFTLSASLYDVAPWGTQKVYSRVVGKSSSTGSASQHGRVYLNNDLTSGDSSLDRDNGLNVALDFRPWRYMDFGLGYTHSVHFQTDILSFGVGFNLSPLLRRSGISRN
jgi:hypothetical protein